MHKHQLKITLFSVIIGVLSPLFLVFSQEKNEVLSNNQFQELLSAPVKISFEEINYNLDPKIFITWKTALYPQENYHSEVENVLFCQEKVDKLELCSLIRPTTSLSHLKKGATISVQEDKIAQQLKEVGDQIRKEPKNGKFKMTENGGLDVLEPSTKGRELDTEASSALIVDFIKKGEYEKTVMLAVKTTDPEISTENLDQLGINKQIGHGESNFRGSPRNRIHNIHVATSRFDGHILKPGEEFSFTELLGPVDGTTGYKEELVIKENKTIPEFGGGVCQVSTTMFRVALNAGMKITERHNHAYPVQYYSPQGTDATIYLPKPDFRFLNNTPGHVLIQASFDGTVLSFDFFGTSDDRQVEIAGPKVTQRTPDGKMRTVLYQTVKDASGAIVFEDTFKSFYDNPANYHEPEFKTKPKDWSNRQWEEYAAQHGI